MRTGCECGTELTPANAVRKGGQDICRRCARDFDHKQHRVGLRLMPGTGGVQSIDWQTYWGDPRPVVGASLAILNQWLRKRHLT